MANDKFLQEILYHGSMYNIENIDLNRCCSGTDFGKGFYLTANKSKAENFVQSLMSKNNEQRSTGFINYYRYEVLFNEPKIKIWETPCEEWLIFIMINRRPKLFAEYSKRNIATGLLKASEWDIVIGPAADNIVGKFISSQVSDSFYDIFDKTAINSVINRCETEIYSHQLCFKTQSAVSGLRKVGVSEHVT